MIPSMVRMAPIHTQLPPKPTVEDVDKEGGSSSDSGYPAVNNKQPSWSEVSLYLHQQRNIH